MHEILCSSPAVSANNLFGTREGQSLPEFRKLIDYRQRWEENYRYPWPAIKKIWLQYWDHSKPFLLDKSPPNLIRTAAIAEHFSPAIFIAMTRNPYVHCEGLMRRDKMTATAAAQRSIQCLLHQKQNLDNCSNILLLRYEDLTTQASISKTKLLDFLPELGDLQFDQHFKAHNQQKQALKITNLNEGKLERLSTEQLNNINEVFKPHRELLTHFGYNWYIR